MFALNCQSYKHESTIPAKFTHHSVSGGEDVSPGFSWEDPPVSTKSFALSIIDPHPVANNWIHWLISDIPFRERSLQEGASGTQMIPPGSKELLNSFGETGYGGPAPPKGSGVHPYHATLYALNVASLALRKDANLRQFEQSIEGKVIAEVRFTGYFER